MNPTRSPADLEVPYGSFAALQKRTGAKLVQALTSKSFKRYMALEIDGKTIAITLPVGLKEYDRQRALSEINIKT